MTGKKLHYSLLFLALIFCILMLSDATFIPSRKQTEIVTDFKERISGNRSHYFHNYAIVTSGNEYDVRIELYSNVSLGDSVYVYRSVLTHAKQKMECNFKNTIYQYNLGFAGEVIGIVFLSIMISIIIAVMVLYEKINYLPARTNVTFFIIINVSLFFYFHFQ